MSKYRKKTSFPTGFFLFIAVAVILCLIAGGSPLLHSGGGVNTPPSGGATVPPDEPPSTDENDDCLHNKTAYAFSYIDAAQHCKEKICEACGAVVTSVVEAHTFENGVCKSCGYSCIHDNTFIAYREESATQHRKVDSCMICSMDLSTILEDHSLQDGVCVSCGYGCSHEQTELSSLIGENGFGQHWERYVCTSCGCGVKVIPVPCTYQNGNCTECGYSCGHKNITFTYNIIDGTQHNKVEICNVCEIVLSTVPEAHAFENGACKDCGYGCGHENMLSRFLPQPGTSTHITERFCRDCGTVFESKTVSCDYTNSSPWCDFCAIMCVHSDTEFTYESKDGAQHIKHEMCKVCKKQADYVYEDHTFDGESCVHCDYKCDHALNNLSFTHQPGTSTHTRYGYCQTCGYVIWNGIQSCDYKDDGSGICMWCEAECSHPGNPDTVVEGHNNIQHVVKGFCKTCGKQVTTLLQDHTFTDGVCIYCDHECPHDYINGICTYCNHSATTEPDEGDDCEHSGTVDPIYTPFDNARHDMVLNCKYCGEQIGRSLMEHTFEDGVCSECHHECPHNYVNGTCTYCNLSTTTEPDEGEDCQHAFEAGVCVRCGYTCAHNYVDGVCTLCNSSAPTEPDIGGDCQHVFENMICIHCGYKCNHAYNKVTSTHNPGTSTHLDVCYCEDCGLKLFSNVDSCTYEDGICKWCEAECPHPETASGDVCEHCGSTKEDE